MINIVRKRGLAELFESDRIPPEWAVVVAGYNLKEKNKLINEVSDNIIKMTPKN